MTREMLRCEARDAGRSQTAQREAGAPSGMRSRSGNEAPVTRSARRPALPDPRGRGPSGCRCGRPYDTKERHDADGHFSRKPLRGAAFRALCFVACLAKGGNHSLRPASRMQRRSAARGAPARGSGRGGEHGVALTGVGAAHGSLHCTRSEVLRCATPSRKAGTAAPRGISTAC